MPVMEQMPSSKRQAPTLVMGAEVESLATHLATAVVVAVDPMGITIREAALLVRERPMARKVLPESEATVVTADPVRS